jgi:hypothetical protein
VVDLGPHQRKAVEQLHTGSILRGGVGTGKSRTALAYYVFKVGLGEVPVNGRGDFRPMERPIDIVIITTAKKRDDLDWEGEALDYRLSRDSTLNPGGISFEVDSWNNIHNYVDKKGAFFIFDEQRASGAGQWSKTFIKIARNNEWILLSATPGDRWEDYIPVFIANGYYKNRTEFMRQHVVFKPYSKWPVVDHYVEISRLQRLRNEIEVDMPYDRHTVRHVENIFVEYDQELFDRVTKDRWHIYEDRPLKDVGEMFVVMRKLVNSDISRLGAIIQLLETHNKLIVFYNYDYELETLRTLKDTLHIPMAEWNGHKHQAIPETDDWVYLVQYSAGAEGWNCIKTDAMAFYSLNYSYRVTEQCKGRIDRLNTPFTNLHYFMLRSHSMADRLIVKALAQKRTFNEKEYIKEMALAA